MIIQILRFHMHTKITIWDRNKKWRHEEMEISYRIHEDLINILDYIFCRVIYLLAINLFLISCQMHNSFYF